MAPRPDSNLINNKVTTVAGTANSQHAYTLTFNTPGNYTAQGSFFKKFSSDDALVAVSGGGSGFISCVDFIVEAAPSSGGNTGDNGVGAIAPIAMLVLVSVLLALF